MSATCWPRPPSSHVPWRRRLSWPMNRFTWVSCWAAVKYQLRPHPAWARSESRWILTWRPCALAFSGLLGTVTAAHIHCCTLPGNNVGVATMTPTFAGFPTGVTAGSYDQTFNMALSSSYSTAYINNNGGTVGSAFNALTAGLDAGKAYFNLHTSSFGGGEVRAVLTPVPEPTTSGMALVGLALVGATLRSRRQA